nr:ATP-binding cassette domain-containing protein [uncultured Clostridium sp.]
MISINNFSKKLIKNDINLLIDDGITYIKGCNGSGKTILLDCIAKIDKDFEGTITGNQNVIYLNQQLYFYGRLKCKDLIQLLFGLSGIKNCEEYYIANLRLKNKRKMLINLSNKKIGKLSGGELKLFYFSIITAMQREWYLFDEPFAQVDSDGKDDMINVLKELREEGKSIIITSHEDFFLEDIKNIKVIDMDNL